MMRIRPLSMPLEWQGLERRLEEPLLNHHHWMMKGDTQINWVNYMRRRRRSAENTRPQFVLRRRQKARYHLKSVGGRVRWWWIKGNFSVNPVYQQTRRIRFNGYGCLGKISTLSASQAAIETPGQLIQERGRRKEGRAEVCSDYRVVLMLKEQRNINLNFYFTICEGGTTALFIRAHPPVSGSFTAEPDIKSSSSAGKKKQNEASRVCLGMNPIHDGKCLTVSGPHYSIPVTVPLHHPRPFLLHQQPTDLFSCSWKWIIFSFHCFLLSCDVYDMTLPK